MVVRGEYFGFEVEVASFVVEMVVKVEGFDFEVVVADFVVNFLWEHNSEMMEDIENIEKILYKDSVFPEPKG